MHDRQRAKEGFMKRASACLFAFIAFSAGCLRRAPPGQCFAYCVGDECLLCDDEGCTPLAASQTWDLPACGEGADVAEPDPARPDDPTGVGALGVASVASVNSSKDEVSGCTDDPGCPTATPDPELLCAHDGQCAGGVCLEGFCHAPCLADADCGTGDLCVSQFCARDPAPAQPCLFSADCPAEHVCVDATCFLACGVDANCPDPVDFCDRGLCRPDWRRVSECSSGADCTAAEDCVDGQCLTACFDDGDCVECADGPVCDGGYCGGEP
jgi:hypothetical protein